MRQRVVCNRVRNEHQLGLRPSAATAAAVRLFVLLAALIGGAAVADTVSERSSSSGLERLPDAPTMLLAAETSPPNATPLEKDLRDRLRITLRDAINASGRFQAHSFRPGDSLVRRALNEHLIGADDLVEPFTDEKLQRISKAIGAHCFLHFSLRIDGRAGAGNAVTTVNAQQLATVSQWIVLTQGDVAVPLTMARRRLKPDDIVNLTIDDLLSRFGIVSHLAGNLHIIPDRTIARGAPRERKPAPEREKPRKALPGDPKVGESGTASEASPTAETGDVGVPTRAAPAPNGQKGNRASAAVKGTTDTARFDTKRPSPPTELDANAGKLPTQPTVAPPPAPTRPDYEAQAARYRQSGDVTNTVLALRKAVNERPGDSNLRRQLIQAYQTRRMPDMARSEALRALQFDPSNSTLFRLYGEVLMTQGDLQGAMQAFRDGVRANPDDITCQVALGDAYLADNRYPDALAIYTDSAKKEPKSPLPHRRLARAYAARAATDPALYASSAAEMLTAKSLTPDGDTAGYFDDYVPLLRTLEANIRAVMDDLQSANQARVQAARSADVLLRSAADLKQRSLGIADFLDKLPPSSGQALTQAHYAQAAAHLLQSVGFFKELLGRGDDRTVDAMKSAQIQAQRELTEAGRRLSSARNVVDTGASSPSKSAQ